MVETYDIYEDRDPTQYTEGGKHTVRQHIVKEVPLTIMLNGKELATLLCSPHSFELLALGFLVNEGMLQHRDELKSIAYRPEQGAVCVETTTSGPARTWPCCACAGLRDWAKTTTGGAARTDDFLKRYYGKRGPLPHFPNDEEQIQPAHMTHFTLTELLGFATRLNEEAYTFKLTGGVHEAALAHREGFVVSYEDVGRHNALDRVLGYTFLNDIDTSDKAVILSGRIASEMLAKVARIGVPVVVSRKAPTSLSIAMAEQLGITLVAFARGNSLSVYTHPDRVLE